MKPIEWDSMPVTEQRKYAIEFFATIRGQYIVGQALYIAQEALLSQKYPEQSNAEDMQLLGVTLFNVGYSTQSFMESLHPHKSAPETGTSESDTN